MGRAFMWWTTCFVLLAVGAVTLQSEELRVMDRVRPVCATRVMPDALVLVSVVDHLGEPLEGIVVSLRPRTRGRAPTRIDTDARGRAVFKLSSDATMRVTAEHEGFVTSVAERVEVKVGCLSAMTLALQIADPKETIH